MRSRPEIAEFRVEFRGRRRKDLWRWHGNSSINYMARNARTFAMFLHALICPQVRTSGAAIRYLECVDVPV
jgi:hypothetical protein